MKGIVAADKKLSQVTGNNYSDLVMSFSQLSTPLSNNTCLL